MMYILQNTTVCTKPGLRPALWRRIKGSGGPLGEATCRLLHKLRPADTLGGRHERGILSHCCG